MNYKILINQKNLYQKNLFSNFVLVSYTNVENETFLIEKKTLQAFFKLKDMVNIEGVSIDICSAYRSVEEQEKLFTETLTKFDKKYAKQYIALPWQSEHHSGLCLDIGIVENGKLKYDNKELLSAKYLDILEQIIIPKLVSVGFIPRYPSKKENITGYLYEPWHYRYVGLTTAKIMQENNLTLEEYHDNYQKEGVLLVNKPSGITSRDVVNRVGHIFDTKKVGHNGTLDPLATGVLVLTINRATKINEYLTAVDKEYIATIKVGEKTDTGDITGKILQTSNKICSKEEIKEVLINFPKKYEQEVPIYSAVKIKGKKLYEYARNNEKVALPKRLVEIKELELLEYRKDEFVIRTVVSKGCYIRSLIQDLANSLDILLTMKKLCRTRQGDFFIDQAYKLENITIASKLLSIKEALAFETIEIPENLEKKVMNGVAIPNSCSKNKAVLFVKNGLPIAIYHPQDDKLIVQKML